MKKTNQKITRYEYKKYYIDIIETKTDFEAWITGKRCGLSSLMFGECKVQPVCENPTFESFLDLVECNLPEYVALYDEEVESIDEMWNRKFEGSW